MSRHWRPDGEIVPGPWGGPDRYMSGRRGSARKARGRGALLVLGAVFVGLVAGVGWPWLNSQPVESGASSPIEWNAVQAVPTRTPDAQDIEWQKRAEQPVDQPIASPGGSQVAESGVSSGTTIYVIDGDTFSVGGQRIRIAGMDAPEIHPPRCVQEAQLGLAATQKLKELLSSGTVTISGSGHDKYGREVRQVSVNGVDVAQSMIAAGLASSYEGKKRQSWC